jgi:hypothetical protein
LKQFLQLILQKYGVKSPYRSFFCLGKFQSKWD